jgi:hypothetical protein
LVPSYELGRSDQDLVSRLKRDQDRDTCVVHAYFPLCTCKHGLMVHGHVSHKEVTCYESMQAASLQASSPGCSRSCTRGVAKTPSKINTRSPLLFYFNFLGTWAQKWVHGVGRGDLGEKNNSFLVEMLSKLQCFGTS